MLIHDLDSHFVCLSVTRGPFKRTYEIAGEVEVSDNLWQYLDGQKQHYALLYLATGTGSMKEIVPDRFREEADKAIAVAKIVCGN